MHKKSFKNTGKQTWYLFFKFPIKLCIVNGINAKLFDDLLNVKNLEYEYMFIALDVTCFNSSGK